MQQSNVVMIEWNIIEVPITGSRHFVGYSLGDMLGRVSTPIKSFNEKTGIGITRSGSIYTLKGNPGRVNDDALYVLGKMSGNGRIEFNWVYPTNSGAAE